MCRPSRAVPLALPWATRSKRTLLASYTAWSFGSKPSCFARMPGDLVSEGVGVILVGFAGIVAAWLRFRKGDA